MLFYGRSGGLCDCLYLSEVGELCLDSFKPFPLLC